MVLEKLSESLKNTLSKIVRSMFIDEKLIDELVRDIQRALQKAFNGRKASWRSYPERIFG